MTTVPEHLADDHRYLETVTAFVAALDPLRDEIASRAAAGVDPDQVFPTDTYDLVAATALADAIGDAAVDGASDALILTGGRDDDAALEAAVAASMRGLDLWGPSLRSQTTDAARAAQAADDDVAAAAVAALAAERLGWIATTETLAARHAGLTSVALTDDGTWKRWVTMADEKVRAGHAEAHGQTVPVHAAFSVAGYAAQYPGDANLPIGQRARCRCVIAYTDGPDGDAAPLTVEQMSKSALQVVAERFGVDATSMSKRDLVRAVRAATDALPLEQASRRSLLRFARARQIPGRHLMSTPDLRAVLADSARIASAAPQEATMTAVEADTAPCSDMPTRYPWTPHPQPIGPESFAAGDGGGHGGGAMIALAPTAEDAQRLAVDGGLEPDDLHVTLRFLGPAADWTDDQRAALVDAAARVAGDWAGFTASAFAAAAFNAHDPERDTAQVLIVQADQIPGLHDVADELAGLGPQVQQFPVFIPHLTLIYADDAPEGMVDRCGEITFDRLRVAFADEVHDFALAAGAATPGEVPDESTVTGDVDGTLATMPDTPDASSAATSVVDTVAEVVTEVTAEIGEHDAEGFAATVADAVAQALAPVLEQFSIVAATFAAADGDDPDDEDEDEDEPVAGPAGFTVSAEGAWEGPIVPEGIESGDARKIAEGALGHRNLPLPLMVAFKSPHGGGDDWASVLCGRIDTLERRDGAWWATGVLDIEGEAGAEAARMMGDGFLRGISVDLDRVEVTFENPEPDPDAPIEEWMDWDPGVMILTAGRIMGATLVPFPAFEEAYVRLVDRGLVASALAAGDDYVPEATITAPVEDGQVALVASGAPTDSLVETPPAEWFTMPDLDGPTPVRVTEDGRIFGHVARFGTCHISFADRCVPVPTSASNYGNFRVGQTLTAEGRLVATGPVVLDTVHPDLALRASDAQAFYAHTGSAVADVAVYEDRFGVVIAGAVRPDITPAQLRTLRASDISPDWRSIDGRLDMVALLVVNCSGFKVAADDGDLALAASGAPAAAPTARAAFAWATGEPTAMVPETGDRARHRRLAAEVQALRNELADVRDLLRPMRAARAKALASRVLDRAGV